MQVELVATLHFLENFGFDINSNPSEMPADIESDTKEDWIQDWI